MCSVDRGDERRRRGKTLPFSAMAGMAGPGELRGLRFELRPGGRRTWPRAELGQKLWEQTWGRDLLWGVTRVPRGAAVTKDRRSGGLEQELIFSVSEKPESQVLARPHPLPGLTPIVSQ